VQVVHVHLVLRGVQTDLNDDGPHCAAA
jgi:hypothetical protein